MPRDPVCSGQLEESKAQAKIEYKGNTYYFCCLLCKNAFEKEPDKYLEEEPDNSNCCPD